MTPDKRFRFGIRRTHDGTPFHGRLMARRGDDEAVVGVFLLKLEEYEALRLVLDVSGIPTTEIEEAPR